MPMEQFKVLAEKAIEDAHYFGRWKPGKCDAIGTACAPIKLLVLCALRYLGRGWTFDDLSESTCISEEVIRVFFHEFILWGGNRLFQD